MADYQRAKKKTDGNEGLYANNPSDSGGETWAGIARNSNPVFKGWAIIDGEKRLLGKQPAYGTDSYRTWVRKLNERLVSLPLLVRYVNEFFKVNYWDACCLDDVRDQCVAEWIFDHFVNARGRGVKWIQEALNILGAGISVDGGFGTKTLAAINAAEPTALLRESEDVAAFYRLDRAQGDPSQIQFLPSWLQRDGVSKEEIARVMAAASDGLTYSEIADLKAMIDATP